MERSAQGQQLRYCSIPGATQFEDVIIDGDLDQMKFVAYYTSKGLETFGTGRKLMCIVGE
jgi:hypothetical protein